MSPNRKKSAQFSVRLEPALLDAFRDRVSDEGKSFTGVLEGLMAAWVAGRDPEKPTNEAAVEMAGRSENLVISVGEKTIYVGSEAKRILGPLADVAKLKRGAPGLCKSRDWIPINSRVDGVGMSVWVGVDVVRLVAVRSRI